MSTKLTWGLSALIACLRTANNEQTLTYKDLINKELQWLVDITGSVGKTPDKTLSRTLQELRDEGFIEFIGKGIYKMKQNFINQDKFNDTDGKKISKGEKLIRNLLTELGIPFEREKKFSDLKDKGYLRFDYFFQIGDKKFVIEFQGKQHYRSIEYFGGDTSFVELLKRDTIKQQYVNTNGITMITISKLDAEIARKTIASIISDTIEANTTTLRSGKQIIKYDPDDKNKYLLKTMVTGDADWLGNELWLIIFKTFEFMKKGNKDNKTDTILTHGTNMGADFYAKHAAGYLEWQTVSCNNLKDHIKYMNYFILFCKKKNLFEYDHLIKEAKNYKISIWHYDETYLLNVFAAS